MAGQGALSGDGFIRRTLPPTATVHQVRNAILELESEAVGIPAQRERSVAHEIHRNGQAPLALVLHGRYHGHGTHLRQNSHRAACLFARWVRTHCANQAMVGVMLPASVGGALVNIAILLAGKVPVNLNFTSGARGDGRGHRAMRIKTILTSAGFLKQSQSRNHGRHGFRRTDSQRLLRRSTEIDYGRESLSDAGALA